MTFRRNQKDTISREEFRKKLDEMGVEYREHHGETIPIRFWWNRSIAIPVTLCNTDKVLRVHRSSTLKAIEDIYNRRID